MNSNKKQSNMKSQEEMNKEEKEKEMAKEREKKKSLKENDCIFRNTLIESLKTKIKEMNIVERKEYEDPLKKQRDLDQIQIEITTLKNDMETVNFSSKERVNINMNSLLFSLLKIDPDMLIIKWEKDIELLTTEISFDKDKDNDKRNIIKNKCKSILESIHLINNIKKKIMIPKPITVPFCERIFYYRKLLKKEPKDSLYLCHDIFRVACDIIESRSKIYADSFCSFDCILLLLFVKHNPNVIGDYSKNYNTMFRNSIAHHQYRIYGSNITFWNIAENKVTWEYNCDDVNNFTLDLINLITHLCEVDLIISDTDHNKIIEDMN